MNIVLAVGMFTFIIAVVYSETKVSGVNDKTRRVIFISTQYFK